MSLDSPSALESNRYGHKLYNENPSALREEEARIRRKKVAPDRAATHMIVDTETQELLARSPGAQAFYGSEIVDDERFVKLYFAGLRKYVGLSKAGLDVFETVYHQMSANKDRDFVLLSSRSTTIPKRTFERGLKDLIEHGFLFRSVVPGQYWVNVRYIFNGDRLFEVKEYRRRSSVPAHEQAGLFDAPAEAVAVARELDQQEA